MSLSASSLLVAREQPASAKMPNRGQLQPQPQEKLPPHKIRKMDNTGIRK
jgi:hypothetical protein